MKYVIDIPQSYYEQIQEYPQQIWIGRDIIKPLQTELEDIKAEIQKRICQFYTGKNENKMIMNYAFEDAIKIIDNHIKELNK